MLRLGAHTHAFGRDWRDGENSRRELDHAIRSGETLEEAAARLWVALALALGEAPVPVCLRECKQLAPWLGMEHPLVLCEMADLRAMRGDFDEAHELIARGRRLLVERIRARRPPPGSAIAPAGPSGPDSRAPTGAPAGLAPFHWVQSVTIRDIVKHMGSVQSAPPRVPLAEVIASLSLATDLATGQPIEHGLRRALLAVWLGEELGLSDEELSNVYYVALLGTVGCTIEGAAFAEFFKDEIALGEQIVMVDPTRPLDVATFFLKKAGEGDPLLRRARKVLTVALAGPTASQIVCRDVALQIGEMLDLGPAITEAIAQCHEHWDGSGGPRRLKGEQLSTAACLFRIAHDADIFHHIGGVDAAVAVARERAGTVYAPRVAERFCTVAERHLRRLQSEASWETVLKAEPPPVRLLWPSELDAMMETIANFVDLRSQYTLGHAQGVATLAERGAHRLGLSDAEKVAVRRAGLLHDLGRAGVPVSLWDKRDPLTAGEWERMKQHPSLTEVVLARSTALGPLGTLAGLHHERLDGSGYRRVPASFLPVAARILAVADAYQSKLELRPHRQAMTAETAAQAIRRQGEQGHFDADVVRAVLDAAGHALPCPKRAWPAGLTEREVEVLQLAVRGLSNREMAEALVVSPKTVGRHIEHIYQKIGVSTRVGAALFAVQHGLVESAA